MSTPRHKDHSPLSIYLLWSESQYLRKLLAHALGLMNFFTNRLNDFTSILLNWLSKSLSYWENFHSTTFLSRVSITGSKLSETEKDDDCIKMIIIQIRKKLALPTTREVDTTIWTNPYKVIKGNNIRAPSSEFVSSSIPSRQILTAHAQAFRGARDPAFCLKVPLDSLLVWASSEGSGETARMRRLAWTFAARIGDKYQIRLTRSIIWFKKKHTPGH